MNYNNIDIFDMLQIYSIYLGLANIRENREQSAHNDIQRENTKQEQHILRELKNMFDEQNDMLRRIESKLDFLLNN